MGKSLLFLVGGLTLIAGYIQVQNNERMSSLPEVTSSYYEEQQARNIAKSLIDNAIENLKVNNDWQDSLAIDDVMNLGNMVNRSNSALMNKVITLANGGSVGGNQSGDGSPTGDEDPNGSNYVSSALNGALKSYVMATPNKPANNSVGSWDEYKQLLVSTSTFEGIEVTTEVLMQRDSYSKYSYMTNSELSSSGGDIWFMGSDNIYGPIHTNGVFKMSGSPSFYGLITSPNAWDAHSTNPTNPNFFGGENFNAPTKESPTNYELDKLAAAAATNGITFDGDIEIEFHENGGVGYADIRKQIVTTYTCGSRWRPRICTSTTWEEETIDLTTIQGVISTSGTIKVEGELKGNITLHSEDEIEITGDITYFTSPLIDSSSTDLLGLVSEGDVVIDRYAHSANGSQDLTIHGSIMALNTSFTVENYNSGGAKGTLNLLGGIVQKNRGPVGTFSGTTIVSGYAKNYQYDGRLKASIPPSFPRESIFSIVYWKDEIASTDN